jgi:ribosomal protein S18 acetylase RimI-like enzyme
MASFRFCRTDDVPLLLRAYESCYRAHFPDLPPLTAEDFKRAAREIDLWASSCMVATVDGLPAAVLLATKREAETLIWAVGVHPGHVRRGFGRHLLASLSAKLAILGPPRIVAEVPAPLAGACAFFEACGFRREREFTDFVLAAPPGRSADTPDLLIPVTLDDVTANSALDPAAPRCWERSAATLRKRAGNLRGLAIASEERIEAFLLAEAAPRDGHRHVAALGCADPGKCELWLGLLLRRFAASGDLPVRMDRVLPEEVPFDLLRSCGFAAGDVTVAFAATPAPA